MTYLLLAGSALVLIVFLSLGAGRREQLIGCGCCVGVRLGLVSNRYDDAALVSGLCLRWPIFVGGELSVLGVLVWRVLPSNSAQPPLPFFIFIIYIYCTYQLPPGGRRGHTLYMGSLPFLVACTPDVNSLECNKELLNY